MVDDGWRRLDCDSGWWIVEVGWLVVDVRR